MKGCLPAARESGGLSALIRGRRGAVALVVLGVVMVSYSGPLVKVALRAGANPVSIAFVRMAAAFAALAPSALRSWLAARREDFAAAREGSAAGRSEAAVRASVPLREKLLLPLSALMLALHYASWMTSLSDTSTFASVALVCTQPLFVAAFSAVWLKERIARRAMPGALIALAGALVIGLSGAAEGGANATRGNLLALLGAVAMAAHWLLGRRIRVWLRAGWYTPLIYGMTAALLGLSLPLAGGFRMPAAALPAMAGLVAGCTLLGHALFAFCLGRVSANVVSFALLGEPVGAMLFGMLLGEIPSPMLLAGGLTTVLGLCLYLAGERRQGERG